MCVIITKTAEQKKPSKEFLQNAWKTNPDGAGFMIADGKNVFISKGFMKFDKFWKVVNRLPENAPIVYHFRIATHGARNEKGTHPFPITTNEKLLQKRIVKTDIGVAHNGIIHLCGSYSKDKNPYDLSDTQLFIKDYLTKIQAIPNWHRDETVITMIAELIKSKMAILDKRGNLSLIGQFVDVDGYKCSNNYFKPKTYTSNYGFRSIYGYDDYDYDYSNLSSYNKKYEEPIVLGEELEYDVFIKNKSDGTYSMISDYEEVKISCYDTVFLNKEYAFNYVLVNGQDELLNYDAIKGYQDILEEQEKEKVGV